MKPVPLAACLVVLLASMAFAAEPVLKVDLGGGTTMDLVLVPAGEFTQGSPANEAGRGADESQRSVRLSRDYYIGRSAVTRGQWERFVAETRHRTEAETGTSGGYGWDGSALSQRKEFTWRTPGFTQTANDPVCLVTFPDAQAFCMWLERKSGGRKVTLPTEAQWEYASRAGTTDAWRGEDAAWHKGNAGNGTRPIDSKPANPWGLFIGGNVSEWCLDWYAPYPAGVAIDPLQTNPNLSDKPRRVLRGGSWLRGANNTRHAARYRADPRSRNADIGFRVVCAVEVAAPPPAPPPPAPRPELPPVEAEEPPAETPPPPVSPPHENLPHSTVAHRSFSFPLVGLLKGLFCLLIPLAVVVMIVRRAMRSQSSPPSTTFLDRPRTSFPAPIRKADDGFWIHGDWPEGTPLKVHYLVAGAAMVQEILYRPGQAGQFVYTGSTPESVSVVAGDDPVDTVLPPPLFGSPPLMPRQTRDDDDDDRPRPPVFPSAY